MDTPLFDRAVNTIRFLAADAVQQANSGHPGAPMGMAVPAFLLYDEIMRHNPADPTWPNRDRLVLSAGHASMLLYACLHLFGYDLPLDEIKLFRQWDSKTPGHPEYGLTPGVEATTGPLGQGFANGVGMAMAQAFLASRFNRGKHTLFDHYIYAICSDGDMQEGVASEAASLAGHLGLGKLIYLYDDNAVQIEGGTELAFSEDVPARFKAYGWHVQDRVDALDAEGLRLAIAAAQRETARPSLIPVRSVIGYGSPEAGTAAVHGSPLGDDNLSAAKQTLGWPTEPRFLIPEDVLEHTRMAVGRGAAEQAEWEARLKTFAQDHPEDAATLRAWLASELPAEVGPALRALAEDFITQGAKLATRAASGQSIAAIVEHMGNLVGGSADLAPSNNTIQKNNPHFTREAPGQNVHFGVREHAMGAILNGMAYHGGVRPYGATFLTFADYMRPPMRLAALSHLNPIYVFTHDSIGLGEDGPTHQPIEHLMNLRATPNLTVIRPADAAETAYAWLAALQHDHGPTALSLTRQKLPMLDHDACASPEGVLRGGYVLWENEATPRLILMGSGSETQLAYAAGRRLAEEGAAVRVVSLPSWELFEAQDDAYREAVLPAAVRARVAVEAGAAWGWERYVGLDGRVVGLTDFGASAPYETIYEKRGVTADAVYTAAKELRA